MGHFDKFIKANTKVDETQKSEELTNEEVARNDYANLASNFRRDIDMEDLTTTEQAVLGYMVNAYIQNEEKDVFQFARTNMQETLGLTIAQGGRVINSLIVKGYIMRVVKGGYLTPSSYRLLFKQSVKTHDELTRRVRTLETLVIKLCKELNIPCKISVGEEEEKELTRQIFESTKKKYGK